MGEEKLASLRIEMILYDHMNYVLSGLTFFFSDGTWAPPAGDYGCVPQKHLRLSSDFQPSLIKFGLAFRVARKDKGNYNVCRKCHVKWPPG
jgi:hypothetical protein